MTNTEKIFADGIMASRHSKAPDFVKANIGIKIGDFIAWADKYSKRGWINLTLKESKGGKLYFELDTYEPQAKSPEQGGHVEDPTTSKGYNGEPEIDTENIPF